MIESAFIVALPVLFLHVCTWEGMIFEKVHAFFWDAPEWVKKPLYDCPICMAPWWGSLILFGHCWVNDDWPHPLDFFLILFMAGAINTVLIYMIGSDKEEIKELKEDLGEETEKESKDEPTAECDQW